MKQTSPIKRIMALDKIVFSFINEILWYKVNKFLPNKATLCYHKQIVFSLSDTITLQRLKKQCCTKYTLTYLYLAVYFTFISLW